MIRFNATKLANLVLTLSVSFGAFAMPMTAQEALDAPCGPTNENKANNQMQSTTPSTTATPDWILKGETAFEPREFEHESFSIRNIIKANVSFASASDEAHPKSYEQIWYHDGRAFGLERKNALTIPGGQKVKISVVQAACVGIDESRAGANLVMRLVLDTLLNRNEITSVEVPSNSFSSISQELQSRNGHVVPAGEEAPQGAKVKFKLESKPQGMEQTIYFQ